MTPEPGGRRQAGSGAGGPSASPPLPSHSRSAADSLPEPGRPPQQQPRGEAVPPACSSSCPPARCRGRRAAGPCTARIAAAAAPTAPAVRPAPPPGCSAGGGGGHEAVRTAQAAAHPHVEMSNPHAHLQACFQAGKRGGG